MGRELKRVPLDFDHPLRVRWPGYVQPDGLSDEQADAWYTTGRVDPPAGEGFQLWETTSEGSPVSPVFATLDELCTWCETGATTFASFRATAAEWRNMLGGDFVHHREGRMIFI